MMEKNEQASEHTTDDVPDSSRSPRSDRLAADDEGSLVPGKGEPHEDDEEEEDVDERGERRITMSAETTARASSASSAKC